MYQNMEYLGRYSDYPVIQLFMLQISVNSCSSYLAEHMALNFLQKAMLNKNITNAVNALQTLLSRPNKVGLKCPSVCPSV